MKIGLRTIQLLDVSFRHTVDPFGGTKRANVNGAAQMEVELARAENVSDPADQTGYAVKLSVTIDDAEKSTYAIRVSFAAILGLQVAKDEQVPDDLDGRLMITGATMLFPYCREMVSNLTSRSSFGPVWLSPANFNVLLAKPNEPVVSRIE